MLGCVKRTTKSRAQGASPSLNLRGGREGTTCGPRQARKGSRMQMQTESRRPTQLARAGGCAGAGGAWRGVAAGGGGARVWAWPDGAWRSGPARGTPPPLRRGPPRAVHVRVPRLRLLARSFPPSPQLRPSRLLPPPSLS